MNTVLRGYLHSNGFAKCIIPGGNNKPHLAMGPARLKARMDSLLSFPVRLFHPLQTGRFIPTLSGYAVIQELPASG